MIERRKFPRVPKQAIVSYDILSDEEVILDEAVGKTLDFSESGLHLELPHQANHGDRIKLDVNIDGDILTLFGTVAWASSNEDIFEVGLEITHFPEEYPGIVAKSFAEFDKSNK